MKSKFKFIILLLVVLYGAITVLVFNFYRDLALKDAKQEAVYVLDAMNGIRDYISTVQRPLIDELKDHGAIDKDLFDPRLMSSSYIARQIYKIQLAKKNINYDYRLTATNPLNPEHEGTEFENEILEGFKEGKYEVYSDVIKDQNASYFFVGLPIKNSHPSCVECHNINSAPKKMLEQYGNLNNFEGKVGDTIAMVSFKIPVKSILLYHKQEFIVSGVAITAIFAAFLFFVYKIHKGNEKTKLQNELLMINQSRLASMGEMIGNISHQWRQPLAQISSTLVNLELYSERGKLSEQRLKEAIEEANEQVKFMSDTIEDFKNFFNPNMPKSEFEVKQAIEQACKILNATLKKHVIDVKVEIKENFTLYGNINELIQILINIINNAKEAFLNLPQERAQANRWQILITALLQNGERAIMLENNAGNIDKAAINKIFKPHFTTKKSGSGLGLYMSKVIAEKNNARIYAQNINNGVVFTIKFKNS